ncbi:unnamed protein product [Danaus chrysippus]|uniref:(African queen) hypothetical protein n=1 Tax=Danaus chrysippus TaxID=151541 RepID=A0A8J2WAE1_9NEOP|nr:unnamed protein product [Danaus chrysippus]
MVQEDFFHMVDMTLVNAWLLWRRINADSYMPLYDFKLAVSEHLRKAGKAVMTKKRGRPSSIVGTPTSSRGGTSSRIPESPVPAKKTRKTPARHQDLPLASTVLCAFLVLLIDVYAKKLEPGPQAITEATPSSTSASPTSKSTSAPAQKNQKRYATREVILYLTPSQIKALQEGKGLVSPQVLPEGVHPEHREQAHLQHQSELAQHQLHNIKSVNIEQGHIHEKHHELEQPLLKEEVLSLENQQEYDHWRQEQAIRDEQLRLHHYYQELNRAKSIGIQQAVNLNDEKVVYLPYSPEIGLRHVHSLEEQRQIGELENHNQYHSQYLSPLSVLDPRPGNLVHIEKPLVQLQYAPKYNDQKKAILIENFLRLRQLHELERQIAFAKAEKIANSPAVLVHEDVKVKKHQPVAVEKQVKVALPAPVPVKVPHIFSLSQDILKHISLPLVQGKRIIAEGPQSNKFYFNVDKPNLYQELIDEGSRHGHLEIPVDNSKKVTVLRPVWNH